LEQLQRLEFYSESYDKIQIKKNSIIYCDPPYKNTAGYNILFDTENFLNWAAIQNEAVFISEYDISDTRFKLIKTIKKIQLLNNLNNEVNENIYANQCAYELLRERHEQKARRT